MGLTKMVRRELRIALVVSLAAVPLLGSVTAAAGSRDEALDNALVLLYLGVLPFLSLALFWPGAPPSVDPLLRYGGSRRFYVATSLGRKWLLLLGSVSVLTVGTQLGLYGADVGPLLFDLSTTLPVALAGTLATASLFSCLRAWAGRLGLLGALLLTWLSSTQNDLGLLVPSPHLRALLAVGSAPSLAGFELGGWLSMLTLYLLTGLFGLLVFWKTPA